MATPDVELAALEVVAPRCSSWDRAQRLVDIALVLATAPAWGPLLMLVALAKRWIDGPAVFFRHSRLGRHGRTFVLHKIRTTPARFRAQPQDWPGRDFPPRTRLGHWLRRRDLDELPQLWNVLKGDMSLVGPRPETPYHSARFGARMPHYRERWQVRPGLSGLAQLRGLRGDTDVNARLAADLEYIAGRGWRLYAAILVRTAWLEIRRALGA